MVKLMKLLRFNNEDLEKQLPSWGWSLLQGSNQPLGASSKVRVTCSSEKHPPASWASGPFTGASIEYATVKASGCNLAEALVASVHIWV